MVISGEKKSRLRLSVAVVGTFCCGRSFEVKTQISLVKITMATEDDLIQNAKHCQETVQGHGLNLSRSGHPVFMAPLSFNQLRNPKNRIDRRARDSDCRLFK